MELFQAVSTGLAIAVTVGGGVFLAWAGREFRTYSARLAALEQAFPSFQAGTQAAIAQVETVATAVRSDCQLILERADEQLDHARQIRNRANTRLHQAGLTGPEVDAAASPESSTSRQMGGKVFGH